MFLKVTTNSRYGQVSDYFGADNVHCDGTENHLAECSYESHYDCIRTEGAGVVCDTRTAEQIEKCYLNSLLYQIPSSWMFSRMFRDLRYVIRDFERYVSYNSNRTEGFREVESFNRTSSESRDFERFMRSFAYAEYEYKEIIYEVSGYYLRYTDLFHSYISSDFPVADKKIWRRNIVGGLFAEEMW